MTPIAEREKWRGEAVKMPVGLDVPVEVVQEIQKRLIALCDDVTSLQGQVEEKESLIRIKDMAMSAMAEDVKNRDVEIDKLQGTIKALEGQVEESEERHKRIRKVVEMGLGYSELALKYADLQATIKDLKEAGKREHSDNCQLGNRVGFDSPPDPCTCGADQQNASPEQVQK